LISSHNLPEIIQGGMGAGVSDWRLANTVARHGQLGVVSGTALDTVLARRLQLGDPDGHMRHAISHFPWPEMAKRVLDAYFIEGGKAPDQSHKLVPLPKMGLRTSLVELMVLGNFVEVFLAKEGHDGPVGINYLEKIQVTNVPSAMGAIIAGVDVVLVGAGIPLAIPGVLDKLTKWEAVDLKLSLEVNRDCDDYFQHFDPKDYFEGDLPELERPNFLAIIASQTLAKTMIKRAHGRVDGFVIEHWSAGGHNAPPRKNRGGDPDAPPSYGERDIVDLQAVADLGLPFWLAGSNASPEKFKEAKESGARGIQVGTAFAFSRESGIIPEFKNTVLRQQKAGELKVRTDFRASPTGFPFKVVELDDTVSNEKTYEERPRICDMGYLRHMYSKSETVIGYRCASEPLDHYEKKGGKLDATVGRRCLCNGLMVTVGLGQVRDGYSEPPVVTSGDDYSFLPHVTTGDETDYSATDVIDYLLGKSPTEKN
jgi:nitronate monooxygenase